MKEKANKSSKSFRQDPFFIRNDFQKCGNWDIPLVKKSEVDLDDVKFISVDHVRRDANIADCVKTVHFFAEDNKFEEYYSQPKRCLLRLAQYLQVLTPDFSLYTDMPLVLQIFSTFKNRWCGAYWQENGLIVIPTISWSTEESFEFCFDGIEYGSVVAISTLGCRNKKYKPLFIKGYQKMITKINPEHILCYGKAFQEIEKDVISFEPRIFRGGK
jgi:hypothetical protein